MYNTIEEFEQVYSDFFKEANGWRPRHDTSHWTLDDWRKEFDSLTRQCEENRKAEAEAEQRAVIEFEIAITKLIAMGAKDRATAIRWMMGDNVEGYESDPGYFEYENGLPHGYLADLHAEQRRRREEYWQQHQLELAAL